MNENHDEKGRFSTGSASGVARPSELRAIAAERRAKANSIRPAGQANHAAIRNHQQAAYQLEREANRIQDRNIRKAGGTPVPRERAMSHATYLKVTLAKQAAYEAQVKPRAPKDFKFTIENDIVGFKTAMSGIRGRGR